MVQYFRFVAAALVVLRQTSFAFAPCKPSFARDVRSTGISPLFVIDEQAVADAVQWNPKPDPPPPAPVVVESPPVVLEIPKEPVIEEVVAVESAPEPSPVVAPPPPPSEPSAPSIPEVSLDLGDVPVVALAGAALAAFAAGTFLMRGRSEVAEESLPPSPPPAPTASAPPLSSASDVSIPYDAAALLEYEKWRAKFGKGAFDADKYAKFKARYEAVTSSNMAAKKLARDTGTLPRLQELSADADS